ncbi:tyrosine-type recombinase/integrase [Hymenobacter volaticus]|uniref:Tyrosine-type recombinase/integrase n=1 Tax=Hymenobacter volaticus TaxID=2932254 RepID=A0ABY4GDB0_9BACT|nr:tyrosine-type recombinase/integrase [Hymenobacter volaticus]UOQ68877.1 tyrosine-type recombinase/integrase [Hymenobacter volaticus]
MNKPPLLPVVVPTRTHSLVELPSSVARYVEAGLHGAENTKRGYAADLRSFQDYCEHHQLLHLPAEVTTVAGYVSQMADRGMKLATIRRHVAAIAKLHQLAGQPSPTSHEALNVVLDGIARIVGKRQRQAPAFTVAELKQAIKAMDLTTPTGLRDRAVLLLGFAGAFRRSELVALNVEDVELTRQALVIHMRQSKTNQYGQEEDKAVFYAPSADFCPVRAVQEWITCLNRTTGPLFTRMSRGNQNRPAQPSQNRLTDQSVNDLVQRHLGIMYSAHSLRASFVTTAVEAGQSNKAIKNQTKQKTDAMIERYARLDDVKRFNAAQYLGL